MRIDPILIRLAASPFARRVRLAARTQTRRVRLATRQLPRWDVVVNALRGLSYRAGMRRVQRGWAMLRRLWRRSLQFRVVGITLLVSVTLVAAFGATVAYLITDGVLHAKIKPAGAQVEKGASIAADQLASFAQSDDPGLVKIVPGVVSSLASDADPNRTVDVVILRTRTPLNIDRSAAAWPHAMAYDEMTSSRMTKLRAAVSGPGSGIYWEYATIQAKKYLVVGAPVPTAGGPLELYYLFPLDSQEQLVDLVRVVVLLTGVTLIALLALIAALMTRLVVKPVRVAARTAQRLSAGLLDQRMEVRGEDDLALLAAAFNQMAANLQRQIVRLEEMSRLQRRFTSDVSHELRTPLTTVRMAADLLFSSRDEFEPAAARSAELLQAELDRFEGLLTDLLEISRFDAGFAALDSEPTDLVPVVHRVGDRLATVAERCGVSLRIDAPDTPVIAEVDSRRVERILRNLVGNAVEHGEKRPVLVTLAADESAVALTVRDHGVGLKTGEEKLVFNRFWRADPSRARQTGGTGLGLSISLEDARLHGGWLEAWGAPHKGAQFRLTLPVRAGDRLVSSPLRLVPDDARINEASGDPAPRGGDRPDHPNGAQPNSNGAKNGAQHGATALSGESALTGESV
jgi:two-component system sensor histidine kinase MtrB